MGVVHSMKRHDLWPSITATLTYANGTAIDLTSASSLRFIMRDPTTGTVKINAAAVIVTASAGMVRYDWAGTDTDTAGTFQAEWEFVIAGQKMTVPNDSYLVVSIIEDIA